MGRGRVIRRRRAFLPPPGVRSDIDLLIDLARRLGKDRLFSFPDPESVFEELRRASAGGTADYSGITYEKIEANQGVFWPCPAVDHLGTPRLFTDSFPTSTGKARFHPVQHQPPAEEPDENYPFYLTIGRVLAHYQSGTQTQKVPRLQEMMPYPLVEMHPTTARRYGLEDGDAVTLVTRRGSASFKARLTSGIRSDTLFAPFHWGGAQSVNRLTNPALDPISRMPEFKVCAVRIERLHTDER